MKKILFTLAMCLSVAVAYPQPPGQAHGQREMPPHHRQQRKICAGEENIGIIVETLNSLSFTEQKMNVAKMCVQVMPICTNDLKLIVATFEFDNDRLEYLKFAHDYVTDPWNYHLLSDSFSFSTNYNALMNHISGPRR